MLRRSLGAAVAVLVAAAIPAATPIPVLASASADVSDGPPGSNAGPPYTFTTELMGEGAAIPLKDKVMLTRTEHGYRFWSGQQDSHLVVTVVDGKLRFADTGTKYFKKLAPSCQRKHVSVGVAAECRVPGSISVRWPLLVEIWPRLGNDYTDTSTLPSTFAVTVLSDEGDDVAHLGAGPDFFNGHLGRDYVAGGGGNDWIRGGDGNDTVDAGAGDDDIVGMDGNDTVRGADGSDRIWGSNGNDRLWAGVGSDLLICGDGVDSASVDTVDHFSQNCESVNHL